MLTRRRPSTVFAAATIAALAALALGACATSEPAAAPTASATTAPTSTPTPEPTRPALADLVLSPFGLGPLVVGEPVPIEAPDVAVVSYDPVACLDELSPLTEGEPGAGRWTPVYPEERPFDVVTEGRVEDGAISHILVAQPFVATEQGIRVGSSLEELLAVYPDITVGPEENVGLYTLESAQGTLAFEVATDAVIQGYWTPEQLNTVVLIAAYSPGETISPVYATDSSGSCSV